MMKRLIAPLKTCHLLCCLFLACLVFMAGISSTRAASTDWIDLGGGKARMVTHIEPASGKIRGALEVKLNKGWSTYWRSPGRSGIPPNFDFSGSENFNLETVYYPLPALQVSGDISYAGYKKNVTFPFQGQRLSADTSKIVLKTLLGLCEQVCIPASAEFVIDLDQLPTLDLDTHRILLFARLTLPGELSKEKSGFMVTRKDANTLETSFDFPLAKPDATPVLFIEGPSKWQLLPAKLARQEGTRYYFEVDASKIPPEIEADDSRLRYTVSFGDRGFEIKD